MAYIPAQHSPVSSGHISPQASRRQEVPQNLQPISGVRIIPSHSSAFYPEMLVEACERGDREMVRFLLKEGAVPAYWMMEAAFKNGHDDIVAMIADRVGGIDHIEDHHFGNSLLHTACLSGDPTAVSRLIRLGADVNKPNQRGMTPLHLVSCGIGDPAAKLSVMAKLLDNNADIDAKFKSSTPLCLACLSNQHTVVSFLLASGADANINLAEGDPDGIEVRPLDLCCGPKVSAEIFIKMAEAGARTPLDEALTAIGDGIDSASVQKREYINKAWG